MTPHFMRKNGAQNRTAPLLCNWCDLGPMLERTEFKFGDTPFQTDVRVIESTTPIVVPFSPHHPQFK